MKYDISCKVFNLFFSKLLKQYYFKRGEKDEYFKHINSIKKEYKAMILRTPKLSKDNKMAGNLKGAAYFFSMAKHIPNLTPQKLDEIIDFFFSTKAMEKVYYSKSKKGKLFSDKEQDKMFKDSLRSQKSNDEMDWKFTYNKDKHHKYITYNITKCGVCELAKRESVLDFLPCMCKMDYPKYKLSGAKLLRTKTLANNDDCCDFHLTRIK